MPTLSGVHLLPATGEFTYDTEVYFGKRATEASFDTLNTFAGQAPTTDFSVSIANLQAQHPECATVSIVCAWFFDSVLADVCNVFPSTTFIGGTFKTGAGTTEPWRCSGLTQASAGLIPIPTSGGSFIYGGTPSDQSLVRCIHELRARGFRVVFYPFLLSVADGQPWRGRIGYSPDLSGAASTAVASFLGSAAASEFTPDAINLTVAYSGSPTDWTYRRMILHYANLCTVAGGVSLFVIGSELRGLESIRGSAWTKAGTTDALGHAVWDYPFVAGLQQLASDVRGVFDAAGMTRSLSSLANLVTYSADWSSWMGYQHPGESGQWPHLDALYASSAIDFVSFDNYLPLSDWTTDGGGLDAENWQAPTPTSWPVNSPATRGFGLSGPPSVYAVGYLQSNIEGGEKFDWFYSEPSNRGAGDDPNGSGLIVSLPDGDRLSQTRSAYYPSQQILGNKQLRWWWNNVHKAVYDTGSGWAPQGLATPWAPRSRPILFLEYGLPSVDKATNQPNLFYSASSKESGTPYWSIWEAAAGAQLRPLRDDSIAEAALGAIYTYWQSNNENAAGVAMIEWAFCCVWNWDARPFPTFPERGDVWGDAQNWGTGNWQGPGRTPLAAVLQLPDPAPGAYPMFPTLPPLGWSVFVKPRFATDLARHVSGRETRRPAYSGALYDLELTLQVLRADEPRAEVQTVAGFYQSVGGRDGAFWFAPPGLTAFSGQLLGVGDGVRTSFPLVASFGGVLNPVQCTLGVTVVYFDGAPQSSGWTVSAGFGPAIAFSSPPAIGVAVSADFEALWLCRFAEDVADFENFMALLWKWGRVKLQTTRP